MKKLLEIIDGDGKIRAFARHNRDLLKKTGAVALVIIISMAVFLVRGGDAEEMAVEEEVRAAEEEKAPPIIVDVGGEVKRPSVVELEDGCRISDAIEAAGGLTDDADITEVNRAAFVADGEKIFIPAGPDPLDEEYGESPGYTDDRVNINTAGEEELDTLSGVGPVTAEKIISYREENGRFRSIEDIKNVSGIGDKTYEKLKDSIRI